MIKNQLIERGIVDKRIISAFLKVPRENFVQKRLRKEAYADRQLPIGELGEVILKPYIIGVMLMAINPQNHMRILEVGTGSGYQSAILAELCEHLYTIEINPLIFKNAKQRLIKMNYKNITFLLGDGYLGWSKYAPFDRIIVDCSPDHIPKNLLDQLAYGGRMIIPLSYSQNVVELILISKDKEGNLKRSNIIPLTN